MKFDYLIEKHSLGQVLFVYLFVCVSHKSESYFKVLLWCFIIFTIIYSTLYITPLHV